MDETWENRLSDLLLPEMDECYLFNDYGMHSLEEDNSVQPTQFWESHSTHSNFSTESISLLTVAASAASTDISSLEGNYSFFDNIGHKQDASSKNSPFSSSKSYILSFENSTAVPNIPKKSCLNHGSQLKETKEEQDNRKPKRVRRSSSMIQHIMAERRRREHLSRMFITLSALIPGLKKMDKGSILNDTINYVKHLQKRVQELEEQNKGKKMESQAYLNNNKFVVAAAANDFSCISDGFYRSIRTFHNVEVRVSGKDVLIRVMCEKRKDVVPELLAKLEANNLSAFCSRVLPFGSTLDITIIAQMDHEFSITMDDIVKILNEDLLECCDGKQ